MTVEIVSIKNMPIEARAELARQLGYEVEGRKILKNGLPALDPYTDEPVTLDSMAVVPGSAILLQDNAVSFAAYFEEYGDWG